MNQIQKVLFDNQDKDYRDFTAKLISNISKDKIIGVRLPFIKKYAKELYKNDSYEEFLGTLPKEYQEEYLLYGYLTEQIKDFDECISYIENYLPYVDNWAVSDTPNPKAFKKNKDKLLPFIKKWIKTNETYKVRFGVKCLMAYYLDEDFDKSYLDIVSNIKSEEYYVNMMVAWYFATALAKQWGDTIEVIESNKLSIWVHNKAIQKAKESFRVSEENKEYLSRLKRK